MEQLTFHLQAFDGPLDLLLTLIQKNKVDIYDIPIAVILTQYLAVIENMKELDLEASTEFLVLAATLLNIKSKMLLPKHDEENAEELDPREQLVLRLIEYQKCKLAAEFLRENLGKGNLAFYKLPDYIPLPERRFDVVNLTMENLMLAFAAANAVAERKLPPPVTSFEGIVGREKISIRDKVSDVWKKLIYGTKMKFIDIFKGSKSRAEVVVTFLAVLELMKLKKINVDYAGSRKGFLINKLDDGENIDLEIVGE